MRTFTPFVDLFVSSRVGACRRSCLTSLSKPLMVSPNAFAVTSEDFDQVYVSTQLFPMFQNRLPPQSRPDYEDFIAFRWVSFSSYRLTLGQ